MELKCTPLKKKQDEFLIKERLVSNMINYCGINCLSATNARQRIPRTPFLCTIRSYSSQLNHRIDFQKALIFFDLFC